MRNLMQRKLQGFASLQRKVLQFPSGKNVVVSAQRRRKPTQRIIFPEEKYLWPTPSATKLFFTIDSTARVQATLNPLHATGIPMAIFVAGMTMGISFA